MRVLLFSSSLSAGLIRGLPVSRDDDLFQNVLRVELAVFRVHRVRGGRAVRVRDFPDLLLRLSGFALFGLPGGFHGFGLLLDLLGLIGRHGFVRLRGGPSRHAQESEKVKKCR
jgi:hypothetical protein